MKVKERKTDLLFSKYIRTMDGWRCVACGEDSKDYSENKRGLHCSHYWSRGHENTRFDPENCDSLCWYHHNFGWGHGDGRNEYTAYMRKKLGDKDFDLLDVRAHTYKKRDDKLDEIVIKEFLKQETAGALIE